LSDKSRPGHQSTFSQPSPLTPTPIQFLSFPLSSCLRLQLHLDVSHHLLLSPSINQSPIRSTSFTPEIADQPVHHSQPLPSAMPASAFASGSGLAIGSGPGYVSHSHSNSNHRIHPPPSTSTSNSVSSGHHRIHPPPYLTHPYASGGVYYLPEPAWHQLQHQPHVETSNPWDTPDEPGPNDGGNQHDHQQVAPHPFISYMYPSQPQLVPTHGQSQSLPNHLQQHGPSILGNTTNVNAYTPGEYNHGEGEEEISPALSRRTLNDVDTPSVIDPDLYDEILEELEEDEYQPTSAQRSKKGKGKATRGGVKKGSTAVKGKGNGKGKGKGRGKAKSIVRSNGSKQPRITIRGEARPASTSNNNDRPYETYDTDSHINIAYFPGLKNITYPLLAAPEGTFLDVNDLLILHPPALSSEDSHVTVNQYNKEIDTTNERWLAEMGKSKWEMYTCRGCRKTYDGKNARSVARRHLQDKHGIPLSQQARRTRWDLGMCSSFPSLPFFGSASPSSSPFLLILVVHVFFLSSPAPVSFVWAMS